MGVLQKIVFKDGKAFLRIAKINIPIAEAIKLSPALDGVSVSSYDAALIGNEQVIRKLKIGDIVYDANIAAPLEPNDDETTEESEGEEKLQIEEIPGTLIKERGRYYFEISNNNRKFIDWRNYPLEFETMINSYVDAEIINHETVSKIITETRTFTDIYAFAPYNFVPLNNEPVKAQELVPHDSYKDGCFSGYIDLALTTKTPLFIRGEGENLLMLEGKPILPGSSIRGMIRTLVEIVSFGKFRTNEKKEKIFYRLVGDTSRLGSSYRNKFSSDQQPYEINKIKAGLLQKKGKKYVIVPSKSEQSTQFYRVDMNIIDIPGYTADIDKYQYEIAGRQFTQFTFCEIYFMPVPSSTQIRHRFPLKYPLVTNVSLTPIVGYSRGFLIVTGALGRKKHMQWIINEPANRNNEIEISEEVVADYVSDKNRESKANIFEKLNTNPFVPCFYLSEIINGNEKIVNIGHTGLFRIPYEKYFQNHIPKEVSDSNKILDFADSIFGNTDNSSKVYFEDACSNINDYLLEAPKQLKILSSPKLSTFQHYLEQLPKGKDTPAKQLKHWNDDKINIRGYKLYWHRNTHISETPKYQWIEEAGKPIGDSHPKPAIRPLRPDVEFSSRIRFDNLTKEELGALLFSLDLPEGCCHKLGMGKPLGLGSIEIKPTLTIIKRKDRYSKLISDHDGEWYSGKDTSSKSDEYKKEELNDYKAAFAQYIGDKALYQKFNETEAIDKLWASARLKELKTILTFKQEGFATNDAWLKATRYMEIDPKPNEYKDRPVLPKPTEVVQK